MVNDLPFRAQKTILCRLEWGEISSRSFGRWAEMVFLILIPLALAIAFAGFSGPESDRLACQ